MALKRHSKRAYIGLRVAVRLCDGFYYPGTIDNVSEHSVLGTTYYIGGLKNFPLRFMKVKEDSLYGPNFQQVGQSTQLKCGQAVFITYNGREVSGHISGRLLKGKVKVSLDSEVDDVIVRCENIRFLESRKSPRLNENLQRVPVKRELSETIDVPEPQQLYYRLGDGEEYTPSPKTLKNDPLLLEGNDQDIISAAHALTHMSRSPSSPQEDKGLAKFVYKGTTFPLSSPKSWNDSTLSLGYHSQSSPNQSPQHLSSSAPAHDLANVSANSDDADMFSYFGGDLDQAKSENKLRLQCAKKIKYVCTYPQCDKECDSATAIKAHVRTHLGRHPRGPNDSGLLDEEQNDIPEEDFYFDEVEVDELTSSISQMRTSTPPSGNHNPFQAQMASQLLNQSRQVSTPSGADGTPLSPVLSRKLDHDYLGKEPTSPERQDLLRAAFHQTLLTVSASSTLLSPAPGAALLSHAAVSALFPPLSVSGLNYPQAPLQQQHNIPQLSLNSRPAPPASKAAVAPHSTRRPRNDVKKCRKMYGIENRDQWCKDCKWKKACKRFTNSTSSSKPEVSLHLAASPAAQIAL